MSLSPKQIDALEPGDRLYWKRSYVMGNTTVRAQVVEYFVVKDVQRDAGGAVVSVLINADRGASRNRYQLRRYWIYHPTPKRLPFSSDEAHEASVAKARAQAANERAKWRERMKAIKKAGTP